jgi:hypothetical protein
MATNLFGEYGEIQEPDPARVRKARNKARFLRMTVRKEHTNFVIVDYEGHDLTGKMEIDELEQELTLLLRDHIDGCQG